MIFSVALINGQTLGDPEGGGGAEFSWQSLLSRAAIFTSRGRLATSLIIQIHTTSSHTMTSLLSQCLHFVLLPFEFADTCTVQGIMLFTN